MFVPPDGSVYDYSLDFIKGALVKWDERPGAQFKTLPSSYTVVSEVKYKNPLKTSNNQRLLSAGDNDGRSKRFRSNAVLCGSFT